MDGLNVARSNRILQVHKCREQSIRVVFWFATLGIASKGLQQSSRRKR